MQEKTLESVRNPVEVSPNLGVELDVVRFFASLYFGKRFFGGSPNVSFVILDRMDLGLMEIIFSHELPLSEVTECCKVECCK